MQAFRTLLRTLIALCILSGAALAQDDMSDSPVTMSLKGLHQMTATNLMSTAELLDEGLYGFQPTEDVRTMGQILAHVANAQYFFCASAAGEDNPNGENFEETATTKADIVAALQDAFAYCDGVYDGMTDADGAETRNFFGQEMAISGILAFNTAHNYEHYGNLVTYMRLNEIIPPSSRQ